MKVANDYKTKPGELPGASKNLWIYLGAIPVALFFIIMVVLYSRGSSVSLEYPDLLAILNTLFLCAIPLTGAYLAAKSYHETGIFAFLLAGAGLVFFGVSSLYAGWVMPLAGNPNPTVTLHNLGSLFAGICLFAGAHFFIQELTGAWTVKLSIHHSRWIYIGIFILVSFLAVLSFRGSLPLFFSAQSGATSLRQLVLGSAIFFFGVAGLAFLEIYATTGTNFAWWFGLAIWLITIGLTCVLLQHSVGSALGWIGRGAQYLGAVYLMIAFFRGNQEQSVAFNNVNKKNAWSMWPYLEHHVNERTKELLQLNEKLQQEIIERELAQESLHVSEKFYHSLIDNMLEGYAHCRMLYIDGQANDIEYINVNAAFESLTGLHNVIGKKASEMIPGVQSTDPEFFEIYARVASTGKAEQTDRFLNALNSWFSMFIYSPQKDEFIIIFTNITDRKSNEQALQQSEEKHRRLFESMSQAVIYYDAAGKVISANRSAEMILTLTREQILGQGYLDTEWKLFREDGSNLPDDEHPVVVALRTGRQIEDFIIGVTIPNMDAPIWLSTSAIPLFQPGQEKPYQINCIFEDITERRQAEQTLRESEERFATIFRSSPNSIIIARLSDSCIIDVNNAFCSQYNLQREQVVGHNAQEFGLWENQADRGRLLELIREHGQVSGFEVSYRSSSGASGVLLLSATQITLNGEACLLILGHDISKRKQLERALKDQSDFLQQIIITIGQGLTVTNADGRFEMVNPAYARLLGFTVDQLIGQTPPAVTQAEDSPIFKLIQKKRLAGETNSYESQLVRADGSLVHVLVTCTPRLNDGTYTGSIAVVTDLTEIKRAEQLRHEAEERFNKVIRSSPIGIHILGLQDGRSQDANDTFLNIIGYSRAELLGHTAKELNLLVDPEQREAWMPTLLADGRASDIETRLRTKNGEIRHVNLSIETFKMHDETFMMTLMNDITSRKLAEINLMAAHDELEQRVLERTVDLQATNTALERAMKAKDEFLAVMSHELRTPLTGILGLSQAMQLSTYGELNQRQNTAVQNIEKSGQHLLKVINQILEFSKLQTGSLAIQLLPCSLHDICQASLLVVNMLAAKKNQAITFNISPEDIVINVDEQRIKQVLINLLGNAIKFTPDNGQIELKVIGLTDKRQVRISITDTGIGIKDADLDRLFQPFIQLDMRLSRQYEGAGMGLALVKQMVELNGGSVEVESVFGHGSCFSVCLPWPG